MTKTQLTKKTTKPSKKGAPPASKGTPPKASKNNLAKPAQGDLVPINFKVDGEFAKDFKVFAAMHDMKLVELFKKSFEHYKQSQ